MRTGLSAVLVLAAIFAPPTAGAQFFSRPSEASRPSVVGPSSRLGLVGGYFTRDDVAAVRSFGTADESAALDPYASRGRFGFRRQGGDVLPTSFRPFRPQLMARFSGPELIDFGYDRQRQMMQATNFMSATDVAAPPGGWKMEEPGKLTTPMIRAAPDPSSTAFNEYFGLAPAKAAPQRRTVESLAGLVEEQNDATIRALVKRAAEAFKLATGADDGGRNERLASAYRQLVNARNRDRKSPLPSLLLLHASLEKDQILHAIDCLFDTVARDPKFLANRPDLRAAFGDPLRFEEQVRRFARLADEPGTAPEPFVLAAYCALLANDQPRLARAFDAIQRNLANSLQRDRVVATVASLKAAR